MVVIIVIVVALLGVIGLLGLSPLPRWTPWLVPLGWMTWVLLEWNQEVRSEGESQAGLVVIVGVVVAAVLLPAAAFASWSTRGHRAAD